MTALLGLRKSRRKRPRSTSARPSSAPVPYESPVSKKKRRLSNGWPEITRRKAASRTGSASSS
eukprot:scaffold120285_cov28-Tisochrysis_lutea.AAC.1